MANREATWMEAASLVLRDSNQLWMTAPEMVKEIQRRRLRNIKEYSQAVRTLRATLNTDARKQYSTVLRSKEPGVSFALREKFDSSSPESLLSPRVKKEINQQGVWPLMTNGLPEVSHTSPHFPSPSLSSLLSTMPAPTQSQSHSSVSDPSACTLTSSQSLPTLSNSSSLGVREILMVEIDPSIKPVRSRRHSAEVDAYRGSCLCLPSPMMSILGPRKTLRVLNESIIPVTGRPVRGARKRRRSAREGDSPPPPPPLSNGVGSPEVPLPTQPDILQLETCHSLPSYLSEVSCVRPRPDGTAASLPPTTMNKDGLSGFDDPCQAQGKRSHSANLEVVPKYTQKKSKKSGNDSGLSSTPPQFTSSESDSDSDMGDFEIQPLPSSRLLVSRRLSQQKLHAPSMDYGTAESAGDGDTNDDEDDEGDEEEDYDSEDLDVEYIDPSCYPRSSQGPALSRQGVGKDRRKGHGPRAEQLKRKYHTAERGGVARAEAMRGGRKRIETKRNISSLFQPQSPLVNENMKSLLTMDAFCGLSESQRTQLVKFLPAVDRAGPSAITSDCLNNSFFSSAVREWVEQVAVGTFTPEYRAKVRAEERKRDAAGKGEEETCSWKERFFQEKWGDETIDSGDTDKPVPYFPYYKPASDFAAEIYRTIVSTHYGEEAVADFLPPSPRQPAATPSQATPPMVPTAEAPSSVESLISAATPPPSLTNSTHPTSSPRNSPARKPRPSSAKSAKLTHSSSSSPSRSSVQAKQRQKAGKKTAKASPASSPSKSPRKASPTVNVSPIHRRNHVTKKTAQRFSLPSLLGGQAGSKSSKASSTKRALPLPVAKNSVDKLNKASLVIEQLKLNSQHLKSGTASSGQFLTRLPPRTPYQALLSALWQASSPSKAPPRAPLPRYTPPETAHSHSVHHDHFALLSAPHVPREFCLPITSLNLQFPIDVYKSCVQGKLTREEHSYAKTPEKEPPDEQARNALSQEQLNLKMSLPRSLLLQQHSGGGGSGVRKSGGGRTGNSTCTCDSGALVLCSHCRSLYHSNCDVGTLCPTCNTLKSLNLTT